MSCDPRVERHQLQDAHHIGGGRARNVRPGTQEVEPRQREVALDVELLRHVSDPRAGRETDRPRAGHGADERPEQHGLPGAARADDRERRPRLDAEAQVVENPGCAEGNRQMLDLEGRRSAELTRHHLQER
jgi:hypothetical protein